MAESFKRGPNFKNAGRLQELWNNLTPTKQIAQELGYYSSNNVCRAVRSLRRLGIYMVHRWVGHPKANGTQRVYQGAQSPPTPAQLDYWAKVAVLRTERRALKEAEQTRRLEAIQPKPIDAGWFRCRYCEGRTDDPMGHPSCRTAA